MPRDPKFSPNPDLSTMPPPPPPFRPTGFGRLATDPPPDRETPVSISTLHDLARAARAAAALPKLDRATRHALEAQGDAIKALVAVVAGQDARIAALEGAANSALGIPRAELSQQLWSVRVHRSEFDPPDP